MKKKIIITIVMLMFLTGCISTFEHEGKTYYQDILCLPGDQETVDIYKDSEVNVNELPKCDDFKVVDGEYEGVWQTMFIRPLAWALINIGNKVGSYGLSIILVTLLLRILVIPITAQTAQQSENMKSAKPELEVLEKKYKGKKEKDDLMQKGQEQLMIYKKYKIKPLAGCLFAFIQIPFFLAFFQAINRVPVLFEENFLGIYVLGRSPMEAFSQGQFHYALFVVLIIVTTHYSFKLNQSGTAVGEQEMQMQKIMKFMIVFISIISFTLSVGIGLYWIFNSIFTIMQNLFFKIKREKRAVQNA